MEKLTTLTGVAALSSTLMNSVLAFEILCLNSYTFVDIITIHPVMTVRLSIMTMNDMNPSNDSDTAPAQSLSAQPLPPRPAPQSAAQSQTPMPQTPQYVQPGPSMQPQYAGQPEAWAQPLPPQDVSRGVPRIVSQGVSQPVPQAAIPAVQPAQYAAQLVYPTYPVQPTYPAQPMYPTQPTYPAQSAYSPYPAHQWATRHNPIPLRRNHSCKRLRQCQSQCPTQCLPRCPQQCPWSCRSILAVYGARGVARWSIV